MKLHFGTTVWDQDQSYEERTSSLNADLKTEVLIVGGGMSGNLIAHTLANRGREVTVIEARHIGRGSSLANTGLLQYWSDIMLWELAEQIGEKDAVDFYDLCLQSMRELNELAEELGMGEDYRVSQSVYYASHESDVEKLEKEYKMLSRHQFPAELLSRETLIEKYGIDKPAALRTGEDAAVNPYAFIQAISAANRAKGVRYFENTEIDLEQLGERAVTTVNGHKVEFDYMILATGYGKIYPVVEGRVEVNRSYAIASQPLDRLPWNEELLFWETKDPYLYFRLTADKRIIIGGLDEEVAQVETDPDRLRAKYEKLRDSFNQLVEGAYIEIDYAWNALFGTSKDNLPFLGADPEKDNHYYILAYEGNGTCYAWAGAKIVADLIEGVENCFARIVRLDR